MVRNVAANTLSIWKLFWNCEDTYVYEKREETWRKYTQTQQHQRMGNGDTSFRNYLVVNQPNETNLQRTTVCKIPRRWRTKGGGSVKEDIEMGLEDIQSADIFNKER